MTIEELIQKQKGTIIDVRSTEEFSGGHVADSLNIPLQELDQATNRIDELEKPLILCCASGGRSEIAQRMLSQRNIECYNGGSWLTINSLYA